MTEVDAITDADCQECFRILITRRTWTSRAMEQCIDCWFLTPRLPRNCHITVNATIGSLHLQLYDDDNNNSSSNGCLERLTRRCPERLQIV